MRQAQGKGKRRGREESEGREEGKRGREEGGKRGREGGKRGREKGRPTLARVVQTVKSW